MSGFVEHDDVGDEPVERTHSERPGLSVIRTSRGVGAAQTSLARHVESAVCCVGGLSSGRRGWAAGRYSLRSPPGSSVVGIDWPEPSSARPVPSGARVGTAAAPPCWLPRGSNRADPASDRSPSALVGVKLAE